MKNHVLLITLGALATTGNPTGKDLFLPGEVNKTLLTKAGLPINKKDLIDFIKSQCASEADLGSVSNLIENLGKRSSEEREKATTKLLALGPVALPALTGISQYPDQDFSQRVQKCVQQISKNYKWLEQRAAVRLLLSYPEADSWETLIGFLPFSPDEELKEDIWFGLYGQIKTHPELGAVLTRYLKDRLPARRALAGCLLSLAGDLNQHNLAKTLLNDLAPEVRLRTAQGLLGKKDEAGVPILIDLLVHPSVEICWSAEELLFWLAGPSGPSDPLGFPTTEKGQRCQTAWKNWWQNIQGKVNWKRLEEDNRRPGMVIICDKGLTNRSSPLYTRIWLCGCDNRVRWTLENTFCHDAQLLLGNRLLLAEEKENVALFRERDLQGKVLKDFPQGGKSCWRLPNESTFSEGLFYDFLGQKIPINALNQIEKEYASIFSEDSYFGGQFHEILKLRNGNTLQSGFARKRIKEGNSKVILKPSPLVREMEPDGKVVWAFLTEGSFSRIRPCLNLARLGFDWPRQKYWDITPYFLAQLKHPDPEVRYTVIREEFAFLGPQAALAAKELLEACADPHPWVSGSAYDVVRTLGPTAVPFCLKALDDPRLPIQRAAYSSLVACKLTLPNQVREDLVSYFLGKAPKADPTGLAKIANALAHFGKDTQKHRKTLSLFLINCLQHNDKEVRWQACFAISNIGGIDPAIFIPELLKQIKTKTELSGSLVSALGAYKEEPKVFDVLLDFLTDDDPYVSGAAAVVLGQFPEKAKNIVPILVSIMKQDRKNGTIKATPSMVIALKNLNVDPKIQLPILISIICHKKANVEIRCLAAKALENLGQEALPAYPFLDQMTKEDNYFIRQAALNAMRKINPKDLK